MTNRVSESEKLVMEILWQDSPLSSLEIVERLKDTLWNEKTVKTFLNRLVKKKVISFEQDGRRYLYSPCMSEKEFLFQESSGFLQKVFKGNMKNLLATFVHNKQLSSEELAYLEKILETEQHEDSNSEPKNTDQSIDAGNSK